MTSSAPASLYMDVHVPAAITHQLRRRNIDVLTSQEDGTTRVSDENLLARAHTLGRILVTQDIRFRRLAEEWKHAGKEFAGLVFCRQEERLIGRYIGDLEIICKAMRPEEWKNEIFRLPL